jgi:hypothetical protein
MCSLQKTRSHCGKVLHKVPSTQTPKFTKAKQQHLKTKYWSKILKFCKKDSHTEDENFTLEKSRKKQKAAKARINEDHDDNDNKN